jgi:regulator of protease activity HflC (stomatin/prohibitin superfamily)
MFKNITKFSILAKNAYPTKIISNVSTKRNFFTIVPEYKKGIRLGFGKYISLVQPGLRLKLPFYHDIFLLDMRENVHTIPTMQVISLDNVTFEVDASIQYNFYDIKKALLNVSNVNNSIIERCKMELRNKLSSMTINDVLQKKSEISRSVTDAMIKIKVDWGVDISTIQIKDIKFDESMKKAMSTVAEATRQAEAKIINAKSDIETAKQYSEAAKIYAENPMTVRLREFQLWNSVSKNPGTTIYVVPSNLLEKISKHTVTE